MALPSDHDFNFILTRDQPLVLLENHWTERTILSPRQRIITLSDVSGVSVNGFIVKSNVERIDSYFDSIVNFIYSAFNRDFLDIFFS